MKAKNVKVGTRVRLKADYGNMKLQKGSVGTIMEEGSEVPYVKFDGYTDGHYGNSGDPSNTSYAAINIDNLKRIK